MGSFLGTELPFLGIVTERQESRGMEVAGGRVCVCVCVVNSCFPMDHFINIPGQKYEWLLQTN